MCQCLDQKKIEIREKVKTEVEATTSIFEWEDLGDFKEKTVVNGKNTIALPFAYSYIRRKINSEPEKKITNVYVNIIPTFCPFCGEKLEL